MKKLLYSDKLEKILGWGILIVAILIFAFRGINEMDNTVIAYDEAYNATVSANLAKYGEYKVSYPSDIIFYNKISTGQTVLVPTAILYYFGGINDITSALIPLIYGCGCFVVAFILISEIFEKRKYKYIIASFATSIIFLSDFYFFHCSTHLIGESAALFFTLLSALGISLYIKTNHALYMLLSGSAIIATYLTKSSMIFILVTFWGIVFVATFFEKKFSKKAFAYWTIGNIVSFCVLDLIKLLQLGSISAYFKWYKAEWINMMDQSSGVDTSMRLTDKLLTFQTLLNSNAAINVGLIVLPVILYLIIFFMNTFKRKDILKNATALIFLGIAGSSLLVYYLLLGGQGLDYPRRLSVNTILVKIFFLTFLLYIMYICMGNIRKNKVSFVINCGVVVVIGVSISILTIFPLSVIKDSCKRYVNKYNSPEYSYGLMQEFLTEVDELPENATLYVNGWWQEPDITLFLGRKMIDINTTNSSTIIKNNAYLLIGQFFLGDLDTITSDWKIDLKPVDNIEVKADKVTWPYANNSYTIYEIR